VCLVDEEQAVLLVQEQQVQNWLATLASGDEGEREGMFELAEGAALEQLAWIERVR